MGRHGERLWKNMKCAERATAGVYRGGTQHHATVKWGANFLVFTSFSFELCNLIRGSAYRGVNKVILPWGPRHRLTVKCNGLESGEPHQVISLSQEGSKLTHYITAKRTNRNGPELKATHPGRAIAPLSHAKDR